MEMITLKEDNGKIVLVSKGSDPDGILQYGTHLTIIDEEKGRSFVLRVEESYQVTPYDISPLLSDMDIKPLIQDQGVKNVVKATLIAEIPSREDGKSSIIRPLTKARLSNQGEIDISYRVSEGVPIFPATAYVRSCQTLRNESGNSIKVNIPEDFFFHQTLITGATGSGKTVAMKYLAQYFAEQLASYDKVFPGSVLAVNVKEEDFLYMDKPTENYSPRDEKEWKDLGFTPHGLGSFRVYYPGNKPPLYSNKVDRHKCEGITINVKNLNPENLSGLIQNLTLQGSDQLPSIFRYWQTNYMDSRSTIHDFIKYFDDPEKKREFLVLTSNEDEYTFKMHSSTYNSVRNALQMSSEFFDSEGSKELKAMDILEPRKMSVIDVGTKRAVGFGSVLLRDILDKIYQAKSEKVIDTPVLIIIDEVHEFYGNTKSREALETLDAIARKGRSLGIGVIFASQNPEDLPSGLSKVVNSQISFKGTIGKINIKSQFFDPEALEPGFAVAKIYGLSQIKLIKFPLTLGGLSIDRKK